MPAWWCVRPLGRTTAAALGRWSPLLWKGRSIWCLPVFLVFLVFCFVCVYVPVFSSSPISNLFFCFLFFFLTLELERSRPSPSFSPFCLKSVCFQDPAHLLNHRYSLIWSGWLEKSFSPSLFQSTLHSSKSDHQEEEEEGKETTTCSSKR